MMDLKSLWRAFKGNGPWNGNLDIDDNSINNVSAFNETVCIDTNDNLHDILQGLSDNTYVKVLPGTHSLGQQIGMNDQTNIKVDFLPGAVVDSTNGFPFYWNGCKRWVMDGITLEGDEEGSAFTWNDGCENMALRNFDVLNYPGIMTQIKDVDWLWIENGFYQPNSHRGFINLRQGRHIFLSDLGAEPTAGTMGDAGVDIKAQNRDVYDININNINLERFNSGLGIGTEIDYDLYDVTVKNFHANKCAKPMWFKPERGGDIYNFDIEVLTEDIDGVNINNMFKMSYDSASPSEIRDGSVKVHGRGTMAGTGASSVPVFFQSGIMRRVDLDIKWRTDTTGTGNEPARYVDFYNDDITFEDVVFERLDCSGGASTGINLLSSPTMGIPTIKELRIIDQTNEWLKNSTDVTWESKILTGKVDNGTTLGAGINFAVFDVDGISSIAGKIKLASFFQSRGDPSSQDFDQYDLTLDGTWNTLDLSSIVPKGASSVFLYIQFRADAISAKLRFRPNGNSNEWNGLHNRTLVAGEIHDSNGVLALEGSRTIEYKGDDSPTFDVSKITVCAWS